MHLPHTFRGVNAVYVNAYAFPAGTIAVTRGILVNMNSEAELAAEHYMRYLYIVRQGEYARACLSETGRVGVY